MARMIKTNTSSMRAVILAAGDGGRLGHYTQALPKPLVPLNGRPLIDYTLDSLVAAGVRDVVVVTGYREAEVLTALRSAPHPINISFVSNPRYHTGASLSLRAAHEAVGDEPFLLLMSDHLLADTLVRQLVDNALRAPNASFVAADFAVRDETYTAEATKLLVSGDGTVTAIGKDLRRWSAFDTGAFALAPSAWDAVFSVEEDCELSTIFTALAERGELYAADVTGSFWYDVDTPYDLAQAERLLGAHAAPFRAAASLANPRAHRGRVVG